MIASWQRITHRLLSAIDHELAGVDLSAAETNVLAYMLEVERPTVRELSGATAQPPSTLTGVLDRLEGKGLVRREVNAADRRSFTIGLTAAGQTATARVREALDALDARVHDAVQPAEAEGFHHVLDALERHTRGRA